MARHSVARYFGELITLHVPVTPEHETLQLPPGQSITQLFAPLQSALHEPPGHLKVQSAPFPHLYEQLFPSPEHVVSHVPPAHVQSLPLQVS